MIRGRKYGRIRFMCVRVLDEPRSRWYLEENGTPPRFQWEIFDGNQEITLEQLVEKANRLESHVCRLLELHISTARK